MSVAKLLLATVSPFHKKKERLCPIKEAWLFTAKWYSLHFTNE